MKQRSYWVYILANRSKTLYIGVTNHLIRRLFEHKQKISSKSFTAKYKLHNLVYFEETDSILSAIHREKQLKKYYREWKLELIEKDNPNWKDLSEDWF